MAHEHAGQSIIEMMWDQLDIQYAALMDLCDAEETWTEGEILETLKEAQLANKNDAELWVTHEATAKQIFRYLKLQGKVTGLAYAIAKLRNPLNPNLDAIREECAERYVPPADDEEDEDE